MRIMFSVIRKYFQQLSRNLSHLCPTYYVTVLILLWQFTNSLVYYLILEPSYLSMLMDVKSTVKVISAQASLSILSPLAGLLSDVKYGRFKVLKMSTYFMIGFEFLCLLAWIMVSVIVDSIDFKFYITIIVLVISLLSYFIGRVFFLSNILQFGTDQIRDKPTVWSDNYIHLALFVEQLAKLFVNTFKGLVTDKIEFDSYNKIVHISNTNAVVFEVLFSFSLIFTIIVVFLVEKYSNVFFNDIIKGNPYKLVYGVIKFAIKNKKPLRRSAFTYCEDECPSRIDFGKQRYGGPFTTEQVEDVKVSISMTKILLFSSPFFLLELNSKVFLSSDYNRQLSNNTSIRLFLDNGVLSTLMIAICISFFLLLIKPFCSRYTPSILKRIGLSLFILTILFLVYILCGIISKGNDSYVLTDKCLGYSNNSQIHQWKLVKIPKIFPNILQQVLSSLSQMLFYIAVWQFICCQSPQYMKGLLFGLHLLIKAVTELVSLFLLYCYIHTRKLFKFGCEFDYYVLHFIFALVSVIVFTIVTRKYKYRKRDDICNVYQYAEDYYSHRH